MKDSKDIRNAHKLLVFTIEIKLYYKIFSAVNTDK